MINRRISGSVVLKWASLLSPWRGRHLHARRPPAPRGLSRKKVGGEAGGTSPPFIPSDGGGRCSTGRNEGSGLLDPPPGKSRRRGRLMPATPSISSIMIRLGRIMISSLV